MRRDAGAVADLGHRREDVEGAAGHEAAHAVDGVQAGDQQLDLAVELAHPLVAVLPAALEGGGPGELREGGDARQGDVRQQLQHLDRGGARHRVAEAPAAHAERLAERVGGDGLVEHAGLGEQRVVPPLPHHAVVGLVGEHRHVAAPDEVGQSAQVVLGGDPAGGVVGAVEEDGLGPRVVVEEAAHVVEVGPERPRGAQVRQHHPRLAPLDVRGVGREVRAEHEDAVAALDERVAEELLERLRAGSRDDVVGGHRQAVLAVDVGGGGGAQLGQAGRRAVGGAAGPERLDPGVDGGLGGRERAVADLELDDVLPPGGGAAGGGQHGERPLGLHGGRESREGRRHDGEAPFQSRGHRGGGGGCPTDPRRPSSECRTLGAALSRTGGPAAPGIGLRNPAGDTRMHPVICGPHRSSATRWRGAGTAGRRVVGSQSSRSIAC